MLSRRALISAIVLITSFILFNLTISYLTPQFEVTVIYSSQKDAVPALPFKLNENSFATLKITFPHSGHHATRYFLKADDCIEKIKLNQETISQVPEPFCDYERGAIVDFGPYLKPSDNELIVQLKNNGGPGGFNLEVSGEEEFVSIARILLCLIWATVFVLNFKYLMPFFKKTVIPYQKLLYF